jgi:DNA-directed RNA polymerase delta subunit
MSTHDIINKYIPLTEDNISNIKNFIHKFYTEFVENSN